MSTFTHMPRQQLLIVTSVIIVVAMLFANVVGLGDEVDEEGSVGAFIGLSIFGIAVTALLLLVAVPAVPREHRANAVLAFGVAALVTVLAFYTALPFALGAAALHAAGPGEERIPQEGEAPATAGVLIALLAIVGAFVLCIIG
jgi:uncharacterized MnhB-related membrane protein